MRSFLLKKCVGRGCGRYRGPMGLDPRGAGGTRPGDPGGGSGGSGGPGTGAVLDLSLLDFMFLVKNAIVGAVGDSISETDTAAVRNPF